MIAVDEFHGRTERGVRQELYAHFNLIAMTRLLEELREEASQTPNDELQERARDDGGGTGRDRCLDGGAEPAAAGTVISATIDEAPQQVDPEGARSGLTQQNPVGGASHPPGTGAPP